MSEKLLEQWVTLQGVMIAADKDDVRQHVKSFVDGMQCKLDDLERLADEPESSLADISIRLDETRDRLLSLSDLMLKVNRVRVQALMHEDIKHLLPEGQEGSERP